MIAPKVTSVSCHEMMHKKTRTKMMNVKDRTAIEMLVLIAS